MRARTLSSARAYYGLEVDAVSGLRGKVDFLEIFLGTARKLRYTDLLRLCPTPPAYLEGVAAVVVVRLASNWRHSAAYRVRYISN